MNLGGSLTRQVEQDATVSDASPHIVNIGKMVEVRNLYTVCCNYKYMHASLLPLFDYIYMYQYSFVLMTG